MIDEKSVDVLFNSSLSDGEKKLLHLLLIPLHVQERFQILTVKN
jgi:hypothetical protein